MAFTLPQLPYPYNALEPFISEQTMKIHHGNHHQAYVDKLNLTIDGKEDLYTQTPEALVKNLKALPFPIQAGIRNFGGGVANHTFFWNIMKKDVPFQGEIAKAITDTFGDFDTFKQKFSDNAAKLFGSGWTWLVLNNGKLEIMNTPNQDSPTTEGNTPLLVIDVWEHAYYLQYQYKRAEFIKAWFNLVNWGKVNELYVTAKK
ncbi:MAG: superoxide dismutase [Nanoarchaeota archaeon]